MIQKEKSYGKNGILIEPEKDHLEINVIHTHTKQMITMLMKYPLGKEKKNAFTI